MKTFKEWSFPAPWGEIALVSWGNPSGDPVFLVHGRGDSAATFFPLLEFLPDTFHYVAVDLPGNGKSDPFPTGVRLMRLHFMIAVELAIRHLNWKSFIFIGHSMASEIGFFYNAVYPGQIKKFIHLDPKLTIQRLYVQDYPHYASFLEEYYNNYKKYNHDERIYSRRRALESVMRARGLTEKQADVILSRNLKRIGEDQYRLSWDRRLHFPIPSNLPNEYYIELFSKNVPPTLVISALSSRVISVEANSAAQKLLSHLENNVKDFYIKNVEGGHDVHFINPERIAEILCSFLQRDFGDVKAKL